MAGRYATALFELALEVKAIRSGRGRSPAFDALLAESPDLMRLVRSPVFSAAEQSKAIAAVLDQAGIGGLAANFLKVVAANRRLFAVRDIIKAFRALVARHKGEVTRRGDGRRAAVRRHSPRHQSDASTRSPART